MARHALIHSDFVAETSGEGLLLFAKVKPYLERYRKEISERAFRNAEWFVSDSATARDIYASQTQRTAKQLGGK